jgi:hypothetical protein
MKFVAACLVWLFIAVVLGFGIWKVTYGASIWFLIVPVLALVTAVGAIGCKTH